MFIIPFYCERVEQHTCTVWSFLDVYAAAWWKCSNQVVLRAQGALIRE